MPLKSRFPARNDGMQRLRLPCTGASGMVSNQARRLASLFCRRGVNEMGVPFLAERDVRSSRSLSTRFLAITEYVSMYSELQPGKGIEVVWTLSEVRPAR